MNPIDEVSVKLENPLTSLWSLTFEDIIESNRGDAIDGSVLSNTLFFQPSLPLPAAAPPEPAGTTVGRPLDRYDWADRVPNYCDREP